MLLVDGADGNICHTQRSKPVPRNAIIIPLEAALTESHSRGVTQLQTLSREYQLTEQEIAKRTQRSQSSQRRAGFHAAW